MDSIPLNLLMWVAAVAPIVVLMVLMLGLQWGAAKAAPVGYAIALISALVLYKAPLNRILTEAGKGLWGAVTVLLVVWPAILIYEVSDHVGAFKVFRIGMQKFTPNELLQIIIRRFFSLGNIVFYFYKVFVQLVHNFVSYPINIEYMQEYPLMFHILRQRAGPTTNS